MTGHIETCRVRVTGRVQGVGFRFATARRARELGITGWVRNEQDGSVRALIQGSADQVDAMLSWLHYGPPAARVLQVEIEQDYAHERRFDHFRQL